MFHSMMFTTPRGSLLCAVFCLFFSLEAAILAALRFVLDDPGSKLISGVLEPWFARTVLAVGVT